MEKDIGKIKKNENTDIIVRIDDYGGKKGLTIREYVTGDRYTGFTKSGTRIPAEKFFEFREMINSINHNEFLSDELKDKKEEKAEEETEEGRKEEKVEEVVEAPKEKKPRKSRKMKEEVSEEVKLENKEEKTEIKEETINEEELAKE